MRIRIRQEDDRRCTIRHPESLAEKITGFLLADESCRVSSSANAEAGPELEPELTGFIDCHIKRGSIKELVLTIAEKLNFRVQTEGGNDWTLVEKERE